MYSATREVPADSPFAGQTVVLTGELVQMEGLDFRRIQQKPLFVQVGKAVHGVNLAVLQHVKKDSRAGLNEKAFLLDREGLWRRLRFHKSKYRAC
jgi:hypothetical protein